MRQLSRRGLLTMGAGFALAPRAHAQAADHFLSRDGLLEATLEARQDWTQVGGRLGNIYSYNGISPGPLLEACPGDSVRLTLVNRLDESTNLHFHGMHLPPGGRADNALLNVPAGESFTYEFTIPANHEPGLYWYHPHVHGLVAKQVNWGLCGLILIHGGLDYVPEITEAREQLLVLQDFALSGAGAPMPPVTMADYHRGREGSLITANGYAEMPIGVARNGWLRLRVLNASASRFYLLKIDQHTMNLIGTDGGALPAPIEMDQLMLTPGERADLMIRAGRPAGEYRVISMPYDRTGGTAVAAPVTVARLSYLDAPARSYSLPSRLGTVERLGEPSQLRTFRLGDTMNSMAAGGGMMMGPNGPDPMMMGLFINDRPFNPARIDTRVALGAIEDWEIVNDGTMDHPFHVHTNSFQVLDADGLPERAWRDIVQVPGKSRRTLRMRFSDFTGLTVYHCHILDHEDLGMMGTLEIRRD